MLNFPVNYRSFSGPKPAQSQINSIYSTCHFGSSGQQSRVKHHATNMTRGRLELILFGGGTCFLVGGLIPILSCIARKAACFPEGHVGNAFNAAGGLLGICSAIFMSLKEKSKRGSRRDLESGFRSRRTSAN